MSERYELELPDIGITFIADRLRRERQELIGELSVGCSLPGARTVNGFLNTSDFNFSSARAMQDRAKLLKERANTNGNVDWIGLLEELRQHVFAAEREGDPSVDLRTLQRPAADDIHIHGITLPRRHPSILFGDGGSAKSYTGLWLAGELARRGVRVGLWDWELCGEDHRDRLERIFGNDMPLIEYVRCERPLTAEVDRLRKVVRDKKIDYAFFDSIAFACDGRPEDAEIAGRYFRAVRSIGCGSLHIAHVNKSEESDKKPFGSSFWHNGARSTWNVQAAEQVGDGTLRLGFFNRKSNLGPLRQPVSFILSFTETATTFDRADVGDTPEFATKLTIRQRLDTLLRRGSMPVHEVSTELEVDANSIYKTVKRNSKHFILLEGGRVGLRA